MITYDFHPEVRRDLDEIWDFIASDNPAAADRLIAGIVESIDTLALFPHAGHKRPDLTARPLRFIVVREYLIAYAPKEKPLWVVAVMHGRRSARVMAAILKRWRVIPCSISGGGTRYAAPTAGERSIMRVSHAGTVTSRGAQGPPGHKGSR